MNRKSQLRRNSDLDGEVGVINLEDLEVVEADVDVKGADAAGALVHVHRGDIPASQKKLVQKLSVNVTILMIQN